MLALVLGARLLHHDGSGKTGHLDVVGTLFLALFVSLFLVALQERQVLGVPLTLACVLLALASIAGYVVQERRLEGRGGSPLTPPHLFSRPGFSTGSILGAGYFAGFTAVLFVLMLYLQEGVGYTPLQAGLTSLPLAGAGAEFSPLAGRLVGRLGERLIVIGLLMPIAGLTLCVVAVVVVAPMVDDRWTGWLLAVPLLIAGSGSGLVASAKTTLTLANVDAQDVGSASGVLQMCQRLGTAVGIAVVGMVLFTTSAGGQWRTGNVYALAVSAALAALALIPAMVDVRRERAAAADTHHGDTQYPGTSSGDPKPSGDTRPTTATPQPSRGAQG